MKIAFLDRDGTINRHYPDNKWRTVTEPEILKGSIEGMRYIIEKGYRIIIITNQYIIEEGIISTDQYSAFTAKLIDILNSSGIPILDIFHCPHARPFKCACGKPGTGMIQQALDRYPEIDISHSFMCGDSDSDRLCAENSGLKFIGINRGERSISNLSEISKYI